MSDNEATLTMLRDMHFEESYIKRAVQVYQKNYGQQLDVTVLSEIIQRLQEKDKRKNKTQQKVESNNNNNNPEIDDFIPHLTINEAEDLICYDDIDHRNEVGKFVPATILEKNESNLKIRYNGYDNLDTKFDLYSDYVKELYRFAKSDSITKRPAHRFKTLSEGDYIDLNPSNNGHSGWYIGEIRKLDENSGQCQISYEYQNKNFLYWAHIDNKQEIAEFNTKSNPNPLEQDEKEKEEDDGLPTYDHASSDDRLDELSTEVNGLSTKHTSIVTIESYDHGTHKTVVEQAIVPPRPVIDRYPFFSTPLTFESTNNAFRDFMSRLEDMGYGDQAEAALVHTNAESIEVAVEYIINNYDALWHRFIPTKTNNIDNIDDIELGLNNNMLCDGCGMGYNEHLIDHKGEAILKTSNNNNSYYGDLNGRISMSMATQQQRENQKLELEKIRQNIHNLTALSEQIELDIGNISGEPQLTRRKSSTIDLSPKLKQSMEDILKSDIEKKKLIIGPTETCMVCFDDKSINDFYKAPCGHNYCKECLQQHYKIKTKDGDVLKVSCIDPKCDREIPEDEVRQFLTDPELLSKYEKFRRDKLLMLNPNVRFCPKPDCEGHMTGSRWNPKITCPVCNESVCYNCSQHWHGYFVGCNQNVDIGYSKWALNKNVKKCPKCRIRIEKSEGCNHMTCRNCQYQFCWICKGKYSGNHFEPWNIFGCPGAQYTPNFCRCPSCFPRWLNRVLIILFFLAIVLPIVIVIGILWLIVIIIVYCVRCARDPCEAEWEFDPCDCF